MEMFLEAISGMRKRDKDKTRRNGLTSNEKNKCVKVGSCLRLVQKHGRRFSTIGDSSKKSGENQFGGENQFQWWNDNKLVDQR
jgi:hypothetical protein